MLCILNIAFGQCGNMSENNYKKTIAIDLDGVLDNYQKYDEKKFLKLGMVQKNSYKNYMSLIMI